MHTWVTSLFPIIKRQTKHNSHKAPVKNIELLPLCRLGNVVLIRLAEQNRNVSYNINNFCHTKNMQYQKKQTNMNNISE